ENAAGANVCKQILGGRCPIGIEVGGGGRPWTNFRAKSLKGNKKPELSWTTRDVFLVGWREQKFRVKSGDISGYKIFIHHLIHHKNFT
ncbi:hypothetical protein, partial [Duodenibacillus massiliensis]|uniref:hypothetical protein n=1 Tax=Duodenibacillus massiliensis TaxID=1852381 RepID=UPI003AB6C1C7